MIRFASLTRRASEKKPPSVPRLVTVPDSHTTASFATASQNGHGTSAERPTTTPWSFRSKACPTTPTSPASEGSVVTEPSAATRTPCETSNGSKVPEPTMVPSSSTRNALASTNP